MDFTHRLSASYYKTIAVMNESHKIYFVQHSETKKIFIKKILDVYNIDIYKYLYHNPVIGIPKIIDFYEENQQLTVIEEYISGTSLEDKIQQHALSVSDITGYVSELCTLLQALHHAAPPIVHRDIKPSNIIISSCNHAVLLDFNAAKFFSPEHSEDTVLLGTHGYAAPEQYGFGASSPQTDIYALGIVLKEMADSLPVHNSLFDPVIETCTRLSASERYSSVDKLKEAVDALEKNSFFQNFPRSLHAYSLPGFRSRIPWKMFLASLYYLSAACLCGSLTLADTYGLPLFFNRLCAFGILLFWVFGCFNYRNIQRLIPLCSCRSRFLHYTGILLLNVAVSFLFFLLLSILETLCSALS